jgi:cytochrome c peroxidase
MSAMMVLRCTIHSLSLFGSLALFSTSTFSQSGVRLTPLELLGKRVFFDAISSPEGEQGCSSCHVPSTGRTTPRNDTAIMPGAIAERFGNRKPPSNAYIVFSPVRDTDTRTGGALWDARADGTVIAAMGLEGVDPRLLGPAADQSILPFTNLLEHNTTAEAVCRHVASADYGRLYEIAWGNRIDCEAGLQESFARIGLAIVAYEGSQEVSPFASRFDAGALSPIERRGFDLFVGDAACGGCHAVDEGAQPGDGSRQLFTGFRTFNIGTPRNPDNPFYRMDVVFDDDGNAINPAGMTFVDTGDGTGRFKAPTLRNVAKRPSPAFVKRFMHNGFFNSLESVVHFYNTRDIKPACPDGFDIDDALSADCWPAAENSDNLAGAGADEVNIGNLGLSPDDEAAIVAFLRTLSDRIDVSTDDHLHSSGTGMTKRRPSGRSRHRH